MANPLFNPNPEEEKEQNTQNKPKNKPKWSIVYYVLLILFLLGIQFSVFLSNNSMEIPYSTFRRFLDSDKIESVQLSPTKIYGKLKSDVNPDELGANSNSNDLSQRFQFNKKKQKEFYCVAVKDEGLVARLEEKKIKYEGISDSTWFGDILQWIFPFTILIAIYFFIFRRMNPGSQIMNIGKNKAALYESKNSIPVTFKDVAGLDEAKEEVMEVVEFLKDPKRFTKLGGKLPKGVLFVGPPGTGKTLLAKAVAGEANVPFFSLSGSDFVEMFVGVGAARVRDLFKQAKEKAPCIVFIDEIDAIGRSRGRGVMMGTNDERENTLNQLLVEMDGFATDKGVILMGATNRPDILDNALLRPGRFDRQIVVDKPDLKGRIEIFKVHTQNISFDLKDVDMKVLASQTPGFAGAEIANVCNEAALLASRRNKEKIEMIDFQDAIERVIAGLEKKNKVINPKEKKIVAFHESGHAIVSWYLRHNDPVQKISIIPRGVGALGYTINMPLEDRYLMTREELFSRICGLLGGRVAEEIVFNEISTGAQNDLERVTEIAYNMVCVYGMSEKIGYLSFVDTQSQYLYGTNASRKYGEDTAKLIDSEVKSIIQNAHNTTRQMLIDNREKLELMSNELLKKEILNYKDIEVLLGKRPGSENEEEVVETLEIQNESTTLEKNELEMAVEKLKKERELAENQNSNE